MYARTLNRIAQALFPLLVVIWLRKPPIWAISGVAFGFFLIVGIIAFLRYYYFVFYCDENADEFVVEKGIVNKTRLSIPFHKIQQVNLQQPLLHRIIGIYKLEIDTAGSSDEEVSIPAVNHKTAIALKSYILQKRKESIDTDPVAQDKAEESIIERQIFQIPFPALLKTGLTSHYFRMMLIILGFILTLSNQFREFFEWEDILESTWAVTLAQNIGILIAIGLFFMFGTLIINMIFLAVRYFGFAVSQSKQALHVHYGLLNKRSSILYPNRVQKMEYSRNYFQKKLQLMWIRFHQAGGAESRSSTVIIPGASAAQGQLLENLIYGQEVHASHSIRPNLRWMLQGIFWQILLPIALILTFFQLYSGFPWLIFLVIALLFSSLQSLKIYFAYQREQILYSPQFLVHKHGSWNQKTSIIQPHKVQSVRVRQYFWQRRSGRATIIIHTAGGSIRMRTADHAQLAQLANHLIHQSESSLKHWM